MKNIKVLILGLLFFCFAINIEAKITNDVINSNNFEKFNNIVLNTENDNNEEEYNGLYEEYLKLSSEQKAALKYEPSYKYKTVDNSNMLLIKSNDLNSKLISVTMPSTYDLRDVGEEHNNYAPEMRNQGPFGLCWAFTFNSMLESYLLRKGYENASNYNFSEIAADIQQKILYDNKVVNGNYDSLGNGDSSTYSYKYTIGITPLGNALLNWTYFNPVLEGTLGTSESSSPLGGQDYTYENIAVAYNNKYKTSGENAAYNLVENIMDEIDISKVTSSKNSPFNVSTGLITSYYSESLMAYNPTLTSSLKASIKEKIDLVKEYILSSGAASTMTLIPKTFGLSPSDEFIHNNFLRSDLATYSADKGGHAVTIIGWDDSYGDMNNDGIGDGSWLVQNSWGVGSNADYFYLSYYDVFSLQGIYGINNVEENTSDNIYNQYHKESVYDENVEAVYQYDYYLGNNKEKIDMLKVYFKSSTSKKISAVINDENNKCNSNTYTIKEGIYALEFTDCILSGNVKLNISTKNTSNKNSHSFNDKVYAVLYTLDNTTSKPLEFEVYEEYSSQVYQNYVVNNTFSEIYYKVAFDKDVNENLFTVKILDQNNNNITNKFIFDYTFDLQEYYNYGLLYFNPRVELNTSKIDIEFYYDNNKLHTSSFILENVTTDYKSKTISIKEPMDIIALNGYSTSQKYVLENDINLIDLTKAGGVFEGGLNLNSSYLDFNGKGNTISGYQSNNGGLFEYLNDSIVYNLKLENFNITKNTTAGILVDETLGGNFNRLYLDNCKIQSDISGGVIGKNMLSSITDIILEDLVVNGSSNSAGFNGTIFYDEYLYSMNQDMIYVKNAFINNLTLNGNKTGIISGNNKTIVKNNTVSPKIQAQNIMFLQSNESDYFGEYNINIYNGSTSTQVVNTYGYYKISNYNTILNSDINNTVYKFNSFGNVSWKIENGKWPQIKCFIDGYIYLDIKEIIKKYGQIIDNYYFIINPTKTIKEFTSPIELYTYINKEGSTTYLDNNSESTKMTTGFKIKFDDGVSTESYKIVVRGDINKDGVVDILDFKTSSNYLISENPEKVIPYEINKVAADIDGNSVIDILDFKKISNYLLSESF